MSLKNRLDRLERIRQALEPAAYKVFLSGGDGWLERWNESGEIVERLTREEFDALPGRKIVVSMADDDIE